MLRIFKSAQICFFHRARFAVFIGKFGRMDFAADKLVIQFEFMEGMMKQKPVEAVFDLGDGLHIQKIANVQFVADAVKRLMQSLHADFCRLCQFFQKLSVSHCVETDKIFIFKTVYAAGKHKPVVDISFVYRRAYACLWEFGSVFMQIGGK